MNASSMNSSSNNAKLPKLSIKPFSENPLEYQSFGDSFEAAIDSNGYINDVVKFNYLKSFLKSQALFAVESLSLTTENYKEAVAILEKRNKQLLISPHIEKLVNLTTVKSVREVKKIREIYDSIEIHVRNLNSLKIETSQYGPILVSIVMSKLPDDIRLLITRTMPTNEEWDVNMLLENLKQEIDSRKMCFRMSSGTSSSTSNNSYESKNYQSEEEEFMG